MANVSFNMIAPLVSIIGSRLKDTTYCGHAEPGMNSPLQAQWK
jgi:hypothetical protein